MNIIVQTEAEQVPRENLYKKISAKTDLNSYQENENPDLGGDN